MNLTSFFGYNPTSAPTTPADTVITPGLTFVSPIQQAAMTTPARDAHTPSLLSATTTLEAGGMWLNDAVPFAPLPVGSTPFEPTPPAPPTSTPPTVTTPADIPAPVPVTAGAAGVTPVDNSLANRLLDLYASTFGPVTSYAGGGGSGGVYTALPATIADTSSTDTAVAAAPSALAVWSIRIGILGTVGALAYYGWRWWHERKGGK